MTDDAIAKLSVTYSQIDRKSLRISAHVELYAIASSVKFLTVLYTYVRQLHVGIPLQYSGGGMGARAD